MPLVSPLLRRLPIPKQPQYITKNITICFNALLSTQCIYPPRYEPTILSLNYFQRSGLSLNSTQTQLNFLLNCLNCLPLFVLIQHLSRHNSIKFCTAHDPEASQGPSLGRSHARRPLGPACRSALSCGTERVRPPVRVLQADG